MHGAMAFDSCVTFHKVEAPACRIPLTPVLGKTVSLHMMQHIYMCCMDSQCTIVHVVDSRQSPPCTWTTCLLSVGAIEHTLCERIVVATQRVRLFMRSTSRRMLTARWRYLAFCQACGDRERDQATVSHVHCMTMYVYIHACKYTNYTTYCCLLHIRTHTNTHIQYNYIIMCVFMFS